MYQRIGMSNPGETCIEMEERAPLIGATEQTQETSQEDRIPVMAKERRVLNNESWKQCNLNTLLLNAVFDENLPEVQKQLEKGASVNARCKPCGLTVCHLAVIKGNDEILKLLLDKGAKTEVRDNSGLKPVHLAAWKGKLKCLKILIHKGCDPNSPIKDEKNKIELDSFDSWSHNHDKISKLVPEELKFEIDKTPLYLVCKRDLPGCKKLLLDSGAYNTVENNTEGETSEAKRRWKLIKNVAMTLGVGRRDLFKAVDEENEGRIDCLLKSGISYTEENEENETPIHRAVKKRLLRSLEILVKWKDSVNLKNSEGKTPLHFAIFQMWPEGIDLLVVSGADIEAKMADGNTTLHCASAVGNRPLMDELLTMAKQESNFLNIKNNEGYTPLSTAVREKKLDCVKSLCDRGADTDCITEEGLFLPHIAVNVGALEILEYLIEFLKKTKGNEKTFLEKKTPDTYLGISKRKLGGATALHLAAEKGRLDFLQLLIKYDKDLLEMEDSFKRTPLHLAAMRGHRDLVSSMLQKGADLSASFYDDNKYKTSAIELVALYIPQPVELLTEIFDSYISIKNDAPLNDPACEIEIKYDPLVPRGEEHKQMSVLAALLNSGRTNLLNSLLLHPLVESFLCLKWQALQIFFWLVICLHFMFTSVLTTVGCIKYVNLGTNETFIHVGQQYLIAADIFLGVSIFFFMFFEVITGLQLRKYYVKNYESWLKWIMLLGGIETLLQYSKWAKNVCAVTVLLAWIEILLFLGRNPSLGYYVNMFCKIITKLLKVLASFVLLFGGFLFAMIIYYEGKGPFDKNFITSSVFITSMAAEPNFEDNFLEDDGLFGQGLGLAFLILVVIGLHNQMAGLAVSDVTVLENQGRAERLKKQIQFFSLIEEVLYSKYLSVCVPGSLCKIFKDKRSINSSFVFKPEFILQSSYEKFSSEFKEKIFEIVKPKFDKE